MDSQPAKRRNPFEAGLSRKAWGAIPRLSATLAVTHGVESLPVKQIKRVQVSSANPFQCRRAPKAGELAFTQLRAGALPVCGAISCDWPVM
jgi:hypothetical protein